MRLHPTLTLRPALSMLLGLCACSLAPQSPANPAATSPAVSQPAERGPLPDDSVYQLDMKLLTQADQTVDLGLDRGHPTIITMFYASCPAACPTLIANIQGLLQRMKPAAAADVRVVMVSFDPEADTPAVLNQLASDHGIDLERWTLGTAPADDVRALAAVLGISYRRLETGHFNHSAVLTVLNRDGQVMAHTEGLGTSPDPLIAALTL